MRWTRSEVGTNAVIKKRSRFIKLGRGARLVNQELEAKARALAGLMAHITSMDTLVRRIASP